MAEDWHEERRREQNRLRDEERDEEQGQMKDQQRRLEKEELLQEERRSWDEQRQRDYVAEMERERQEEWEQQRYQAEVEDVERKNGFDPNLPSVSITFDHNLFMMYKDMLDWKRPVDVVFIPMLALNPDRIFTHIYVEREEILSVWQRPRCRKDELHKKLDEVVQYLRGRKVNKVGPES